MDEVSSRIKLHSKKERPPSAPFSLTTMERTMGNHLKYVILILGILISYSGAVRAQILPVLQPYGIAAAYVPSGFDDNDNAQVTVEGYFPNTCYKVGPTKAGVRDGQVVIQQWAYKYGGMCLDILVPYHQTVNLGLVKAANYRVVDSLSGRDIGTLPVTQSKSTSPDDFLYAPVSDAFVVENAGGFQVAVAGSFSDSCMYFKEIRARTNGNVIEVLPITDRAKLNTCIRGFYPFQKTVTFAKPAFGHYLLHVRSLEGQAINKMVDVR
jgi:hypothetical protein